MTNGKSAGVVDQLIGNKRYRVASKIGAGSFGDIHIGYDVQTGCDVAIKVEPKNSQHPQLLYEAKVCRALVGDKKGCGIPCVQWSGTEGEYNLMVMDLLGPSLEELFQSCNAQFTLKTVLLLADQMISRVEYIHDHNYLHRDIKPDNFLMGRQCGNDKHIVHMIDFGLSKRYRDSATQQHIQYRENKSLVGTARYASINTHRGIEQSRRDDLESLGYVLLYFLRGSLPWQGLKASNRKQKYERISEKKMATPLKSLCSDQPNEFELYLSYVRGMRFDFCPDYDYCRNLFTTLFKRCGFVRDYEYDWSPHARGNINGVKRRERKEEMLDVPHAIAPLEDSPEEQVELGMGVSPVKKIKTYVKMCEDTPMLVPRQRAAGLQTSKGKEPAKSVRMSVRRAAALAKMKLHVSASQPVQT
eukprot:comp13369_c0_seq1/m.8838 comp13369_c0_seq1/g.8838  ORF comp13369_c0_seq1/g.8838 comp13369_c0_seq1/m.8838 type:complete len:415 (-) comp13369_c0_seq1:19-1263(-)